MSTNLAGIPPTDIKLPSEDKDISPASATGTEATKGDVSAHKRVNQADKSSIHTPVKRNQNLAERQSKMLFSQNIALQASKLKSEMNESAKILQELKKTIKKAALPDKKAEQVRNFGAITKNNLSEQTEKNDDTALLKNTADESVLKTSSIQKEVERMAAIRAEKYAKENDPDILFMKAIEERAETRQYEKQKIRIEEYEEIGHQIKTKRKEALAEEAKAVRGVQLEASGQLKQVAAQIKLQIEEEQDDELNVVTSINADKEGKKNELESMSQYVEIKPIQPISIDETSNSYGFSKAGQLKDQVKQSSEIHQDIVHSTEQIFSSEQIVLGIKTNTEINDTAKIILDNLIATLKTEETKITDAMDGLDKATTEKYLSSISSKEQRFEEMEDVAMKIYESSTKNPGDLQSSHELMDGETISQLLE